MQFDVNIRMYEYWHEQAKIRKKRWNNKEIKKFYCKQKDWQSDPHVFVHADDIKTHEKFFNFTIN
jgi:hypothetical protein